MGSCASNLRRLALHAFIITALTFARLPAAAAQEAQPGPDKSAAVGTTAMSPESNLGLTEIVVTAQRREENLQRTAMAVSAVAGEELVNAGVSDVTNLSKLVPALEVQPSVGTATNFYIRGVGSFAANAFTENPIAFNFDGVNIARPAAPLGTFYDLERVEVLKGPQGTLYGRNATGGAINVIPRPAKLDLFGADLTAEYGNYDAKKLSGAVNIPLGSAAAVRVASQIVDRDGYLSDGYDDEKGQAVRGSLLVKPNSWLTAHVVADYFHQGGHGGGAVLVPGAPVPNAPAPSDRIGGADALSIAALQAAFPSLVGTGLVLPPQKDGFVDNKFWGAAATLDADLGFATLTVLPAYRNTHADYLAYNGGYRARIDEQSDQKSLEIRLASNSRQPFGYVIGGYIFDERQSALNNFEQGFLLNTTFVTALHNQSAAGFGQATYSLSDTFRLVGGARYTSEKKSQDTTLTQLSFGHGPTSQSSGDLTFNRITYKAGLEFDLARRSLLYADVATGFKSGGFFIAALDNTFAPEELIAYTIGSKNRFLDNRLQVNLEAFHWDYKDQQINYIGPIRTSQTTFGAGLVTTNAGRSRMDGAEAEINFQLTQFDLLSADIQYLNGRYVDFKYTAVSANGAPLRNNCLLTRTSSPPLASPAQPYVVDCSGKPQINSPQWTASLSYERTFELADDRKFIGGLRTRVESGRYLSPEYLPEEYQGAYHTFDAYLTLFGAKDRWSITGFVNNIGNRTVYAGAVLRPIIPVVYDILRPPRTYGVRLGFHY
jgi:iron complex outermembrane receptor protein